MGYTMSMIDTLKAANTLKENGFNEQQADAIVSIVREREDRLATKQDIHAVGKDVDAVGKDVDAVGKDVDAVSKDVDAVSKDVDAVSKDLHAVSKDLHAVEQGLKQDIALLRNDFGHLEKATKENNTVVRWMIIISITLNVTALVGIVAIFLK